MNRLVLAAAALSLIATSAAAQTMLADANRDGKITPKEYQDSRRTFLMRADTDKNGQITPKEWDRAAASTRMELEERGVDRAGLVGKGGWFQAMDANKDNAVTPAEIDAYTAARFKAKDPNGDGVITRGEAAQLEKTAAKKIN
ncbi:Ca2+-binding EF-hand superfamily protein [Phenylobacterium haematophilum]|jgi:Ca2+-binding EF-hand superfamily protein|uniref:Ca2+-binding EF-hand superfamily protein n=1 Tax=Phenylobacterium haematophilum TaxID=98513 RepID=A0A840A173_9CAUL|nr:hypothetical protein [Phenylobacterium haematophilum]MBB3892148.1 Ca2+-binding EF-hand superfamily protein [Phenylobacterium haematophilum]